jgi:biopolymer transport protein ExbB
MKAVWNRVGRLAAGDEPPRYGHGHIRKALSWALAFGLAVLPSAAHAWWNDEWSGRKPLRIDTSAAGANITEPIGATPVLVRLHAGNFKFDAAKEDGSDLRFIAGDDKTPLKFHLEKYDALLGEALVWVAIPDLKPGSKTDIWLYYKNPKATPAEDAKGTYDPATTLVYHFIERGQPARDYSAWGNQALTAGESTDGALIGRGLKLDGSATVSIPAATSLAWAAGAKMTWSAWVKLAEAAASGVIFSRRDNGSSFVIGLEGGKPFVEVDGGAGAQRATGTALLAANGWHHIAVTAGEGIALYVDGAPAAKLATRIPAFNTAALIGGASAPAASAEPHPARAKAGSKAPPSAPAPLPGFKGELDELQIAKVERPAGFILTAAVSQGTDPGKFLVAGQDEESGSWSSGYFAIIVKSVTLDGWVVIGLLAIMSFVSWLVMINKASYLRSVEKANDKFSERFRHLKADLSHLVSGNGVSSLDEEKVLRNSPLYRVYQIGAEEIRKRTQARRPLSAEAIEAIRASLDAGLVRENQKLTQRMVLLTIAISGGPFLGLLGTVVGVMITFASIAAAGDVNVNAIAPGIAAALVATVAGLAVAIPALFAYNWLLTRVKNVGATMQVFVDEFVTRVAEASADRDLLEEPPPANATIVAAE